MKLQVLVDNHTYIDAYYLGEPAVSFLIEEDGKKILLDTGYSDVLLRNAAQLELDLSKLTHIVFSHGHNDHTRGFQFLKENIDVSSMHLIAHPDCFLPRADDTDVFGAPFSAEEITELVRYQPSKSPVYLTEKLVFLGEIPRRNDFEASEPIGRRYKDGTWEKDYVIDDSALVYCGEDGLFLISGCAHSGICNMIAYAKEVCGDHRIVGAIGGFHLLDVGRQLTETIAYLKACNLKQLYPCHCVSLAAKAAMLAELPVTEVGVGLTLEMK